MHSVNDTESWAKVYVMARIQGELSEALAVLIHLVGILLIQVYLLLNLCTTLF